MILDSPDLSSASTAPTPTDSTLSTEETEPKFQTTMPMDVQADINKAESNEDKSIAPQTSNEASLNASNVDEPSPSNSNSEGQESNVRNASVQSIRTKNVSSANIVFAKTDDGYLYIERSGSSAILSNSPLIVFVCLLMGFFLI